MLKNLSLKYSTFIKYSYFMLISFKGRTGLNEKRVIKKKIDWGGKKKFCFLHKINFQLNLYSYTLLSLYKLAGLNKVTLSTQIKLKPRLEVKQTT